jgi:high-affinity nickel-transport protein
MCWRTRQLGFTARPEISMSIRCSRSRAAEGRKPPIPCLLVFPALFTAGMSLVHAANCALMLGAYGWAFMNPIRKLYYNLIITAISVFVAVLIGGVER